MSRQLAPIVGVDFDNTVVSFDGLLQRTAVEMGLIAPDVARSKQEVRAAVRGQPEGEIHWQKLQGVVYGPKMGEGQICDGVRPFFQECKHRNLQLYVVSHKTEYANFDETRTNLRQSAMIWMTRNGFFDPHGLGLLPSDVFFLPSRREKLLQIHKLGCTHFIDDLEEVFFDEGFPPRVRKILYAPHWAGAAPAGVTVAASWQEIGAYILDGHQQG